MAPDTSVQIRRQADAVFGFRVHLVLYLVVNGMLVGLNSMTAGPWWAVWPLLGWGVGVLVHGLGVIVSEEVPDEVTSNTHRGSPFRVLLILTAMVLLSAGAAPAAYAHCDTMDGPVVIAAQRALQSGNVNHALLWIQPEDEPTIRAAFGRTLEIRKQGVMAREVADLWFFETLVRLHRKGEGAPYTGLKPAGLEEHPAVAAADRALATGSVTELERLLTHAVHDGLLARFQSAMGHKQFDVNDLAAGRAYVQAYVPLIHYAEAIYDLARAGIREHAHETTAVPSQAVGR